MEQQEQNQDATLLQSNEYKTKPPFQKEHSQRESPHKSTDTRKALQRSLVTTGILGWRRQVTGEGLEPYIAPQNGMIRGPDHDEPPTSECRQKPQMLPSTSEDVTEERRERSENSC